MVGNTLHKAIMAEEEMAAAAAAEKSVDTIAHKPYHEVVIEKHFCLAAQLRQQLKPSCGKCLLAHLASVVLQPKPRQCAENVTTYWDDIYTEAVVEGVCHGHDLFGDRCLGNTVQLLAVSAFYLVLIVQFLGLLGYYAYAVLRHVESRGYDNAVINIYFLFIAVGIIYVVAVLGGSVVKLVLQYLPGKVSLPSV